MLVVSHFMDKITHVCGKPLKVQELAAYSPPILMQKYHLKPDRFIFC